MNAAGPDTRPLAVDDKAGTSGPGNHLVCVSTASRRAISSGVTSEAVREVCLLDDSIAPYIPSTMLAGESEAYEVHCSVVSRLIALSGIDGSGKTSAAHALTHYYTHRGIRAERLTCGPLRLWRMRQLLVASDPTLEPYLGGRNTGWIGGAANKLAFAANIERMMFIQDQVMPALLDVDVVLLERYILDWMALGRVFGADQEDDRILRAASRMTPGSTTTVYLQLDAPTAYTRLLARGLSLDPREDQIALERAADAYNKLAPTLETAFVVDASRSPHEVVEHILKVVGPI